MKPSGPRPPIIGSFEDIGKNVVSETAKLPGDMVGSILESLGAGSTKSGKTNQTNSDDASEVQRDPNSALTKMEKTSDQKTKQSIARAALQELAKGNTKTEPTIYDEKQKEIAQNKDIEKRQKELAAKQSLPQMSSKRRRGDLYGIKGKSSSEMSKNVRQD